MREYPALDTDRARAIVRDPLVIQAGGPRALYQGSEIVTPEGLPAAAGPDSRWQTHWSLPCLSRFVPILPPSR